MLATEDNTRNYLAVNDTGCLLAVNSGKRREVATEQGVNLEVHYLVAFLHGLGCYHPPQGVLRVCHVDEVCGVVAFLGLVDGDNAGEVADAVYSSRCHKSIFLSGSDVSSNGFVEYV